ncbi:short chain oxidoreductase [Collybia nuda]|uniref:Short chain oxidoreductase n=1 Tax=Collybia nuda TaxID=64659 RepID=A0A9P5Y212_9AGAR|nr:short chain oxidoreductase [Collybia nuda]
MDPKGVALVTGAASGIGKAIALRLASDGFDIALNDLESSKGRLEILTQEITQKGRRTSIVLGDVSQEVDVKRIIDTAVHDLGGLDVTVANAGIVEKPVPFPDTKVEDWDRIFSINSRGVFLCYKYAAQQMIKQGRGGRIIGASSIAGKQGDGLYASYCSSKFAVRGLTQSAAKDLGPHKITVNAYAPGYINTPMLNSIGDNIGDWETFKQNRVGITPMGRLGEDNDVASIVSYLASKESHFITGQSISVNGGIFFD